MAHGSKPLLKLLQPPRSLAVRCPSQVSALEQVQLCQCHGAPNRMAQEGTGMHGFSGRTRPGLLHNIAGSDTGREREPAGERLAHADQVGSDRLMLAGKPTPRAPKAGVDFIQNQYGPMGMASLSQPWQKTFRGHSQPCPGLNGFDKDGPHRALFEQALQPIETLLHGLPIRWILEKMAEWFELALEWTTKMRPMGHRQSPVAQAMISA